MTNEEFKIVIDKQIEEIKSVFQQKTDEYVVDKQDRFRAFKLVWMPSGREIKVNPKITLWGQMVKHISSIYDYCLGDEEFDKAYKEEWKQKITDTINYLILLRGIVEEICANQSV